MPDVLIQTFDILNEDETTTTVEYRVSLDGPFGFGISNGGGLTSQITWQVACPYERIFCDYLLGVGQYVQDSPTTSNWPNPRLYPGHQTMRCVSAQFAGFVGSKKPSPHGLTSNGEALIVADYARPVFDITGASLAERFGGQNVPWSKLTIRSGFQEFLTPPDEYLFDGEAWTAEDMLRRRIPIREYLYRRSMIPVELAPLYEEVLRQLDGTLNLGTFMDEEEGWLFFDGWEMDQTHDAAGNEVCEYAMNWRRRWEDWNKVPDPEKFNEWKMAEDAEGNRNYEYADWTPLLTYGVLA